MLPPSPGLLPSFVTHPSVPPDPCVYRRAPGELTGSPLVKIQSKLGKLRSFGPCDITTGRGTRFMDAFVSVTDANLKDAAVQFGCKLATHCSVLVQWSLAKQHLFNQVEGGPQSVTEGKLRTRRSPGL